MTGRVEILNLAVVGPLVRDVERGRDGATVRIFPPFLEQIGVQSLVQIVHGIVERQENDLRYLLRKVVTYFFFSRIRGSGSGGRREGACTSCVSCISTTFVRSFHIRRIIVSCIDRAGYLKCDGNARNDRV